MPKLNLGKIDEYDIISDTLYKKLEAHASHLSTEIARLQQRHAHIQEILATKPTFNKDRTY